MRRIEGETLSQLLSRCRNRGRQGTPEGCHSKTTCNDRTLKTFVFMSSTFSPTKLHPSSDKDVAAMYFLNSSFQIGFYNPRISRFSFLTCLAQRDHFFWNRIDNPRISRSWCVTSSLFNCSLHKATIVEEED